MEYAGKVHIELNAKNSLNGNTAFICACDFGHLDIVRMFLDYSGPINIDFNVKNNQGQTGFDIAAMYGKTEIVTSIYNNLLDSEKLSKS